MSAPQGSDPSLETRRLKRVFGIVYFSQGMKGLPDLSIFYFMMNILKLGPVAGQLFQGLSHIAWFIKPLWGWISDHFPLFGYRRKSYFLLMALIALLSWFAVGLCAYFQWTGALPYFLLINIANLAYAFVDVVVDAVMVEEGQKLKKVGLFVNYQWLCLGFALIIVSLFSGWFQQKIEEGFFSYGFIFGITGLFPLLTAIIGILNLREERISRATVANSVRVQASEEKKDSRPLGTRFKDFCRNERHILLLVIFIVAWHFSPSIGYVGRIYRVKELAFTPVIFGVLGAVNSVVWIFSILFYRWFVRRFQAIRWDHYLYGMIGLGVIALVAGYYYYLPTDHPWSITIPFPWEAILSGAGSLKESPWLGWIYRAVEEASTWNRYHWWALFTDTLLGFASIPAWLIPLTLAGEAASRSNAGFIYAILMSVSNFTNAIEDVVGGGLYKLFTADWMQWFLRGFEVSIFNISRSHDLTVLILQIFVYISAFFTVVTVPFVYWVKKEFAVRKIDVRLN